MTTLTVEINKEKDLSAIKDFIAQLGLKYEVDEHEEFIYTDDVKRDLDKRYLDYMQGNVKMISEEESQKAIEQLFYSVNK